jgi:hypothetical protein
MKKHSNITSLNDRDMEKQAIQLISAIGLFLYVTLFSYAYITDNLFALKLFAIAAITTITTM